MRGIIIEPLAKSDLIEACEYYDARREGLGFEFFEEVKSILYLIGENPLAYAAFRSGRKAVMHRFPFVMLYRFDDEKAFILGVFHGKRDPAGLTKRIP